MVEDHAVPGANFDPKTASAARLEKFGLPMRPTQQGSANQLSASDWDRMASGVMRRAKPKPGCVLSGVTATSYSMNYSGYRATAASGKAYSGAHSSYTAPANYYLSTCSQESMTQWVGVSNDTVLFQAGVYVTQVTGSVQSGGFYEIVGGSWETRDANGNPSLVDVSDTVPYISGHRYYFDVHYATRYDWSVTVNDLDNGNNFNVDLPHPEAGGTQYIQPYAYFVSERLAYGDLVTQYMNHSDVRFRTAFATIYGEGDARLSIQRPEQVIMLSPGIGNARLSNPDPIEVDTSSFTEHWARCGVVE
jgi:hypothetical protein